MNLRSGIDSDLELAATQILEKDRRDKRAMAPLTKRERQSGRKSSDPPTRFHYDELNDWLTEDQLELRTKREVLAKIGVVGEYQISGLYKRSYNPLLNKRPSSKHLYRPGMDPWNQLLWEEFDNWFYHAGMAYSSPPPSSDLHLWPSYTQSSMTCS